MKRALRRARDRSRLLITATVAVLVTVAIPSLAGAGHQAAPPVPSFTGCLSNPEGGRLYRLQVGDGPANCLAGDPEVHLSGGDITGVNAGPGLEGGGTEAGARLSLARHFCAELQNFVVRFGGGLPTDCGRVL